MDWNSIVLVKNISEGRVVAGAVSIAYNQSMVVDLRRVPEDVVNKIKLYEELGLVKISEQAPKKDKKESLPVSEVNTIKNEKETRSHTVYDANKSAVSVKDNVGTGKAIEVRDNISEGRTVVLGGDEQQYQTDKEAKEFLSQHWKKVESQVKDLFDIETLEYYLSIAEKDGVAEKKIEMIKDRIDELK